ncbi:MAG TPA: hypothetical protein VLA09_11160 [Longimicrobiales bacterium]|nr:hypothetical protein [Longimicrobiales bacterium]
MPSWWMVWPGNPGMSSLLLLVIAILVMYGARAPAHRVVRGIAGAIIQGCRLAAEAIDRVRVRVAARNREVLLSGGLHEAERRIELEFQRISASVRRDLGMYPSLHRQLSDQVRRVDEDYGRATDTPPAPEAWNETIAAAGELAERAGAQAPAAKAVQALRVAMQEAHDDAMNRYRVSSRERHKLLAKMVPTWRSVADTLTRVEKSVTGAFERSQHLDELMRSYRRIAARSDAAERALGSSAMTQFVAAALLLAVALLGGSISFQLIALPMSEMVGATSRLGSIRTADAAALVIILLEVTMGLFLMESLRVTRLFPVIGRLDRRTRVRMAWATFSVLLLLAGTGSSLAYARDMLFADRVAPTQTLTGGTAARPELAWIPSVGRMALGFVLPFALVFVAIPLESFIRASRSVGGRVMVGLLRLAAFSVSLLGLAADHAGKALENLYDILIFLPLRVEKAVVSARTGAAVEAAEADETPSAA